MVRIISLSSPQSALKWCEQQRNNNLKVGFVPTMGALHQGHLSLVAKSVAQNDVTCASIYVNPLQFNNADDLDKYPVDLNQDIKSFEKSGCYMVFTGTLAQFFPHAAGIDDIEMKDSGPAGDGLEGEFRPGHLQGVVTIVERLFESVGSCSAYFGEKDFQQTLVVKQLSQQLKSSGLDIDVITCPTIREKSGLALSSRNQRLSSDHRRIATNIYKALCRAKEYWQAGIQNPAELESQMRKLVTHPEIIIDYVAVRDQDNWTGNTPVKPVSAPRALIAATIGGTRLIDNLFLGSDSSGLLHF